MSLKIEYICDICADKKQKEDIKAVVFSNNRKFTLWPWNSQNFMDHKGKHICDECLQQLKK